jgi:hypothetical protein
MNYRPLKKRIRGSLALSKGGLVKPATFDRMTAPDPAE